MQEKLVNINALTEVLKTISFFDILELKADYKQLASYLPNNLITDQELLEILDLLVRNQILHEENMQYCLYNRIEESFKTFIQPEITFIQKQLLSRCVQFNLVNRVDLIPISSSEFCSAISFADGVREEKKIKTLSWLNKLLPFSVFEQNSKEVKSSPFCNFILSGKQTAMQSEVKNAENLSLNTSQGSTIKFKLEDYLTELSNDLNFNLEFERRELFIKQWVLPKIQHSIKRNRIV